MDMSGQRPDLRLVVHDEFVAVEYGPKDVLEGVSGGVRWGLGGFAFAFGVRAFHFSYSPPPEFRPPLIH